MSRISRVTDFEHGPLSPTPELAAHHDLLKPIVDAQTRRAYHQVRARLEALVDDELDANADHTGKDRITAADYEAGERYRRDFEAAMPRIRGTLTVAHLRGGTRTSDGVTDRQVDALARVRRANEAIGPVARRLVVECAVYDRAWARIGESARNWTEDGRPLHHNTAKLLCCEALRTLCAYYAAIDGSDAASRRAARTRSAMLRD